MNRLGKNPRVKKDWQPYLSQYFSSQRFQQKFLMFVLMLGFGIILMSHIMTVRADNPNRNLVELFEQRQQNLAEYQSHFQALQDENAKLTLQKTAMIDQLLINSGQGELQAELEKARILAGLTEVSGPGLILILDDFELPDMIVHDFNVRHALELLNGAGAAAFSINGNRFTNASNIDCIGLTIRCNQERLSPPYVIIALGDPEALATAVFNDQDFNTRQATNMIKISYEKSDRIVIPAFAEADNIEKYIDRLEVVAP